MGELDQNSYVNKNDIYVDYINLKTNLFLKDIFIIKKERYI